MRRILLLATLGSLLTGCPTVVDDDDAIEPITPEDEVVQDFIIERTVWCAAGGWSTTADATATQYELYTCMGPTSFPDAVYDVGTGETPVWQSDGSTDGTFTAYTNPMYGIVETTTVTTTESN